MAIHKPIHLRELLPRYVAIAVPTATVGVFPPFIALFLPHECIGVLGELFPDSGMLLQVLLQRRMLLDKLIVPDQRRILPQLLLDFRMAVEEFVHVGDLPALGIVVLEWHAVLGGHATRGWRALSTCRRNDPEQQTQRHERHGA